MSRNTIKYIVVFATFVVLGILLIQFLFLKKAIDISEKKFHTDISETLFNVASDLVEYNNKVYGYQTKIAEMSPVEQISSNYYIVNINHEIDQELLEHSLIDNFRKNHIKLDFEYAIYDCETDQMSSCRLIKAEHIFDIQQPDTIAYLPDECEQEEIASEQLDNERSKVSEGKKCTLPKSKKYTYYFGIDFPGRSVFFHSSIRPWYFATSLLFLVLLFFGYSLYVIIKQRRLSVVQKNFINNLTHEFKTPIASISLATKVIRDDKTVQNSKRLNEYAKIILEQNKRLSLQVEKVLQMASIERKRILLNKKQLDLDLFIEKTIAEFRSSQDTNALQVSFNTEINNAKIKADPVHFSNLIFNILDNAVKYCDDSPEIHINLSNNSKYYILSFADNGIGIPKKFHKKIFARFYRIPTGDVHNVKGFGLGLDYVKQITDRHRWKISITDNPKKGTIFILKISKNSL